VSDAFFYWLKGTHLQPQQNQQLVTVLKPGWLTSVSGNPKPGPQLVPVRELVSRFLVVLMPNMHLISPLQTKKVRAKEKLDERWFTLEDTSRSWYDEPEGT
jgi:hypothetical protein